MTDADLLQADLDVRSTVFEAVAGSYAVFAVTQCKGLNVGKDPLAEFVYSLGESLCGGRDSPRQGHGRCSRCRWSNAAHLVLPSQRDRNDTGQNYCGRAF